MIQTYKIPEENMENLQKKIKLLNNKSMKLVNTSITLTITGEEFIQNKETKEWNKLILVEIRGEAPHWNGWEFIAVLQHDYSNGNIIRSAGDQVIPIEYRTVPIKCDHCGINRFRKDTYLVKNTKTREIKQVGSSCLRDFFNGKDPHTIAKYAELLFDMDETVGGCSGSGQPTKYIELKEYLNVVNEVIKRYGFMSAKKANEIAESGELKPMTTAQETYQQMFNSKIPIHERIHPTKESEKVVENALQWIKNQSAANDYMHNLITICSNDYIGYKEMGVAASLMATYYNTMVIREEKKEGNFLGILNEKIEIKATLIKSFSYETQYGITKIYKFQDKEGNILVWKTGSRSFEENKDYKLKGTIKEHGEYKGEKQTQITRCKVESL